MRNPVRSIRHFEFADTIAWRLESILPAVACSCAAATCRIQLMGFRKGTHNGPAPRDTRDQPFYGQGRWVRTSLHTFGNNPGGSTSRFRTALTGKWSFADSFEGADTILACFGLTMRDVIDHFGNVGDDDRIEWDLIDIIEAVAPNSIVRQSEVAAA